MMGNTPTIDILLSTFNGQRYVVPLLESIYGQSYREWRLLVRDDGSTDGTVALIQACRDRHRDSLVLEQGSNIGVRASFEKLLRVSSSPCVMLCDQDDIWYPTKIERSMRQLRTMERDSGHTPCLVYSDMHVVADDLSFIAKSFWGYHGIVPIAGKVPRVLIENPAAGCTMIFNRKLIERALPLPSESIMHDWWLLLAATFLGRVSYLEEPTLSYRQHTDNAIGARGAGVWRLLNAIGNPWKEIRKVQQLYKDEVAQAQAFLERYSEHLEEKDRDLLRVFIFSHGSNPVLRRKILIQHRILYSSYLRRTAQLLFL